MGRRGQRLHGVKRVAAHAFLRGKRARTIVASQRDGRWFFIVGFEKNERADITLREWRVLQELARDLLDFDDLKRARAEAAGELWRVGDDDETSR